MRIIDNTSGQFRVLAYEIGMKKIGLSEILKILASKGTKVKIITKPNQSFTEDFIRRLDNDIEIRKVETLHEKGLVTNHFYLRGSMNFTYSGVNLNDEHIEITSDPKQVALALHEADRLWDSINND